MTIGDLGAIGTGGFLGLGIAFNLGLLLTGRQADADTILIGSYCAMAVGSAIAGALTAYGDGYFGGSVRKEPVNGAAAGMLMVWLTNVWLTGVHTISLTDAGPLVIAFFAGFLSGALGGFALIKPRKRAYYKRLNKEIGEWGKYIEAHPQAECAPAWYNKANAFFRLKRYDEAQVL